MLYGQTPKWIDRVERLMPGLGIPNLALYLVGAQALGFLATLVEPQAWQLFILVPSLVLKGELWRLVTFMAMPLSSSALWMVFVLSFLYFVINGLEEEWGAFRTTLYVLVAVLLTIGFSFTFDVPIVYIRELQSTLLLAAATIAPEYQIMIWLVIPVKMKWLAWLTVAYIIWALIVGSWLDRLYLLVMYANYLLFFGPYLAGRVHAFYRRKKFQRDVAIGTTDNRESNE
jgi:hypothetical protein